MWQILHSLPLDHHKLQWVRGENEEKKTIKVAQHLLRFQNDFQPISIRHFFPSPQFS